MLYVRIVSLYSFQCLWLKTSVAAKSSTPRRPESLWRSCCPFSCWSHRLFVMYSVDFVGDWLCVCDELRYFFLTGAILTAVFRAQNLDIEQQPFASSMCLLSTSFYCLWAICSFCAILVCCFCNLLDMFWILWLLHGAPQPEDKLPCKRQTMIRSNVQIMFCFAFGTFSMIWQSFLLTERSEVHYIDVGMKSKSW